VEIAAIKRVRRGDPGRVRVEATRFGAADANVLVCAIWGESTTCDTEGYHSRGRGFTGNEDIRVDFAIRLPAGVRARLESVNGTITVDGATADLAAETTNGDITITDIGGAVTAETTNGDVTIRSARGPVRAETVNGAIGVEVAPAAPAADLALETVNGSVTVWVASGFQGTIDMETTHGTVHTDFPVTVQGRFDPRHVRARIGSGGGRISLATVNGDLSLRKAR
jgi:DUF4097 and DUF4098 domain-containing protein YvlB